MNQQQVSDLLDASQQNANALAAYFSVMVFVSKHWIAFGLTGMAYLAFWVFLIYDDLQREEGIDRLTYLVLLIGVPFFGALFYCMHALDREAEALPAGSKAPWMKSMK